MADLQKQKLIAAALRKLQTIEKDEAFDANLPASRPTKAQAAVIDAVKERTVSVIACRGGNQCLAKGTLVATSRGPVPIEALQVGDTVYDEQGKETYVMETFVNGEKEVCKVFDETGYLLCKATPDHVFPCEDGTQRALKDIRRNRVLIREPETGTVSFSYIQVQEPFEVEETYDIHVNSPRNLYCLANGLVTHNSGKSAVGARIVTWLLQENFPEWEKPKKWTEPLQILILARTLKQAEESLWRKMEPFLEPGTYKVVRAGGVISKVTHIPTGNSILFFSHNNVTVAREQVQSFTANFAWIDELPGNVKLIEEVMQRVRAKAGQVLLTFTPKSPAPDITRFIEGLEPPHGKNYILKALDNPVYSDEDKKNLVESLKSFSENYRNTVLRGDWLQPDEMVYDFDYDTMVHAPPDYSPSWRHVEASDPALSSAHGLVVAAEHPSTGRWYIIKADYLKNILVPDRLVEEVRKRTEGINIVRRIADPHETWYIQTAIQKGMHYVTPYKKHERKAELIKSLQQALGTKLFIAPWCQDLIDELTSCHWSETGNNKIVKASRFHLCDSSQYLVDCLPKYEGKIQVNDWWTDLRLGNERRKKREQAQRNGTAKPYVRRKVRRRR